MAPSIYTGTIEDLLVTIPKLAIASPFIGAVLAGVTEGAEIGMGMIQKRAIPRLRMLLATR